MRSRIVALLALLAIACGPSQESGEAPPEAPPPAPAPTLADFAGTWENTVTLTGVEAPVISTTRGGASGTDWTMDLEGRPGIRMQARMQGDSLVMESEQYESILRAGVMTSVRTAAVLRDGAMEGNVLVTYQTPGGVEQVPGTILSRRLP
jgi:hypothetical protein